MLWRHEIHAEPGFEVAVNHQVVRDPRVYAGSYDQVHLVSWAPELFSVSAHANCREGIPATVIAEIRLQILKPNLADVLKDSGYSTYQKPFRVTAKDVVQRQNLAASLKALIQSFIRSCEFFGLTKQDDLRVQLNQKVQDECARAKLHGEVLSCEATPVIPDAELLSQLRARAGMTETIVDGMRKRTYEDNHLKPIIDYFMETLRQKELMTEDVERNKDEAEKARLERQQILTKARTELKIVEAEEQGRLAHRQGELQSEEALRNQEAQKRNAEIKETSAEFEFAYKANRLKQEMELIRTDEEVVKLRMAVNASVRDGKRLDIEELEVKRERLLAEIRNEERANALLELGKLLDGLKELPVANYSGVQTLVVGGPDSREQFTNVLVGVLASLADGLALQGSTGSASPRRAGWSAEAQGIQQTENTVTGAKRR